MTHEAASGWLSSIASASVGFVTAAAVVAAAAAASWSVPRPSSDCVIVEFESGFSYG